MIDVHRTSQFASSPGGSTAAMRPMACLESLPYVAANEPDTRRSGI